MRLNDIEKHFGNAQIVDDKIVITSDLHESISYLNEISYSMLKSIAAVDLGDDKTELIYHLYSGKYEENLRLSIIVEHEAESITDIFSSAIADENEIFDMFGVYFINNDKLKRIYMPENWEGNPLRKDYEENDSRLEWNEEEKDAD